MLVCPCKSSTHPSCQPKVIEQSHIKQFSLNLAMNLILACLTVIFWHLTCFHKFCMLSRCHVRNFTLALVVDYLEWGMLTCGRKISVLLDQILNMTLIRIFLSIINRALQLFWKKRAEGTRSSCCCILEAFVCRESTLLGWWLLPKWIVRQHIAVY